MLSRCAKAFTLVVAVALASATQALEANFTEDAAMSLTIEANAQRDDAPLLKKKNRLRFKNGPVCLCSDGLSEKNIRDAALQQRIKEKSEKQQ